MADKIPDSQILPAGAHAEKKSVHNSDPKKSLRWTVLLDNIKLLAAKIIKTIIVKMIKRLSKRRDSW